MKQKTIGGKGILTIHPRFLTKRKNSPLSQRRCKMFINTQVPNLEPLVDCTLTLRSTYRVKKEDPNACRMTPIRQFLELRCDFISNFLLLLKAPKRDNESEILSLFSPSIKTRRNLIIITWNFVMGIDDAFRRKLLLEDLLFFNNIVSWNRPALLLVKMHEK